MRFTCAAIMGLAIFAGAAQAIGTRTHAEMAERAMDDYLLPQPPDLLPGVHAFFQSEVNRRAIYSGNAWTDWGYGGINQEAGEDGHWFPFLNAYAALLKERFPPPWTPEAEREIAFFLGTLCHSITDLPWHFGNATHPSFIQAATAGDGSDHITCDFGSDIFTHTSQTLHPTMGFDDFFYPIDTVYAAYERFGKVPSRKQMEMGATRERTIWLTGQNMAWTLLSSQKTRSPWVVANMEGYYFGGVQNNAANVAHWFRYYYAWFQGGRVFQNSPEFANGPPGYLPYAGTEDTTLLERLPGHNTGAEPYLGIAGNGPGDRREARLRFDLSDAGLTSVSKATLWVYVARRDEVQQPGDKEVACYTLAAPWQEGAQFTSPEEGSDGRLAEVGEITWAGVEAVANNVAQRSPAWLLPALTLAGFPLLRRKRR
jgi:hypothetical protein